MLKISGLIILAVLVSACNNGSQGQVERLSPQDALTADVSGNEIREGKPSLFGRTFQNADGTIAFQKSNAESLQVLETCVQDDVQCAKLNRERSADFTVALNGTGSDYSRIFLDQTWATHAQSVAGEGTLVLRTTIRDPNGKLVQAIAETFSLSDDPCDFHAGPGLEAKQVIHSVNELGYSATSQACQAYF